MSISLSTFLSCTLPCHFLFFLIILVFSLPLSNSPKKFSHSASIFLLTFSGEGGGTASLLPPSKAWRMSSMNWGGLIISGGGCIIALSMEGGGPMRRGGGIGISSAIAPGPSLSRWALQPLRRQQRHFPSLHLSLRATHLQLSDSYTKRDIIFLSNFRFKCHLSFGVLATLALLVLGDGVALLTLTHAAKTIIDLWLKTEVVFPGHLSDSECASCLPFPILLDTNEEEDEDDCWKTSDFISSSRGPLLSSSGISGALRRCLSPPSGTIGTSSISSDQGRSGRANNAIRTNLYAISTDFLSQ